MLTHAQQAQQLSTAEFCFAGFALHLLQSAESAAVSRVAAV